MYVCVCAGCDRNIYDILNLNKSCNHGLDHCILCVYCWNIFFCFLLRLVNIRAHFILYRNDTVLDRILSQKQYRFPIENCIS